MLLSGYFLSTKQIRLNKVFELWLQMFFWSVVLFAVVTIISGNPVELRELIKSLLPFTQQRYWFMTTYLLMYLLLPILNTAINAMTRQQYKSTLLIFFIVFICMQNVVFWREFTSVNSREPLFFCFLYMIGAYFRKYPVQKKIPWIWVYIVCCAITAASRFVLTWITISIFGEPMGETVLSGYCSITNVIGAVALFMTFANLKFDKESKIGKLVVKISPLTLGIYLIHDHANVRTYIWNLLHPWSYIGSGVLLLVLFIDSIMIFTICCLLEWMRQKLFEVCKVNKLIINVGNKIEDWIQRVVNDSDS